jgi:hypothetical protein
MRAMCDIARHLFSAHGSYLPHQDGLQTARAFRFAEALYVASTNAIAWIKSFFAPNFFFNADKRLSYSLLNFLVVKFFDRRDNSSKS